VTVANGNTLVFDYSVGTLEKTMRHFISQKIKLSIRDYSAKGKTTPILKMDYTYWSTPVVNQN
jgi:hypothetical protein